MKNVGFRLRDEQVAYLKDKAGKSAKFDNSSKIIRELIDSAMYGGIENLIPSFYKGE